jgi:membrane protease subunit HflC
MNGRSTTYLSILATLGILLYVAAEAFFTVDQRERAVLLQFGEIVRSDLGPGLHFKIPLAQSVAHFDSRLKTIEETNAHLLTSDQKDLQVVYFAKWRVADPAAYYRGTNGGQELVARDRLTSLLDRGLRDAFSTRAVAQIVADDQNAVAAAVIAAAREPATALGVELTDLRLESLQLPADVAESVYERMRAERLSVAAEARARGTEQYQKMRVEADQKAQTLLADAYRDAEKMRGEGDAKAAEIYSHSFGQDPEFFRFYRSLNAYREIFQSDRDVLVLQAKGEFFRYFNPTADEPKR